MNLEFRPADRPIISTSLDILDKAIETAHKSCAIIGVPTMAVETVGFECIELRKASRRTESPEDPFEIPPHLAATLRVGLRLYLDKLEKVSAEQMKLIVQPEDTQERISEVRRTFDRAMGQGSLLEIARNFRDNLPEGISEVSISSGGGEPVTIKNPKHRASR